MDAMALLLSRLQFAFTISFHIIFPAFSIGLAAWLTILEALRFAARDRLAGQSWCYARSSRERCCVPFFH
jgi:cytochrome bd-type quinol oxidase subunit 1